MSLRCHFDGAFDRLVEDPETWRKLDEQNWVIWSRCESLFRNVHKTLSTVSEQRGSPEPPTNGFGLRMRPQAGSAPARLASGFSV